MTKHQRATKLVASVPIKGLNGPLKEVVREALAQQLHQIIVRDTFEFICSIPYEVLDKSKLKWSVVLEGKHGPKLKYERELSELSKLVKAGEKVEPAAKKVARKHGIKSSRLRGAYYRRPSGR